MIPPVCAKQPVPNKKQERAIELEKKAEGISENPWGSVGEEEFLIPTYITNWKRGGEVISAPAAVVVPVSVVDQNSSTQINFHRHNNRSNKPRCCTPQHCCNLKCLFQHIGTSGYSIENAVVYANAAFQFMESVGWTSSMAPLVLSIIALILITGLLTLGNYKAYLAIMDNFLSGFSCFSAYERREILASFDNGLRQVAEDSSKRFWVIIAITAAILKVGISSYPLYLVMSSLLSTFLLIVNQWPTYIIVAVVGVLNLYATVAFFNQGNTARVIVEEDADFDDDEEEGTELSSYQLSVPSRSLTSANIQSTEVESIPRSQDACFSGYCVLKHCGSVGYSAPNGALYSNSAFQFMKSWGWIEKQPVLSLGALAIGAGSVTIGNYKTYLAIMDNFLSRFLRLSNVRSNSSQVSSACAQVFWSCNSILATCVKVGVSACTLYRLSDRIFYAYFGAAPAIVITTVVSAANLVATIGFFRQEIIQGIVNRREHPDRVMLLPDDYDSDDSPPVNRKVALDLARLY
jgi:hypothetical protein